MDMADTWLLDDRDLRVTIYKGHGRSSQHFYWRVQAANGRIIAVGGEGYSNRADAESAVRTVTGS